MRFSEVQSSLVALLAAGAGLNGLTQIAWDGTQKNEAEQALHAKGIVIVIDLPMGGDTKNQAAGKARMDTTIAVDALVNPHRNDPDENAEAANIAPDILFELIVAAVIGPNPTANENDRFLFNGFEPYPDDGLIGRTLLFTKRCVL
jgi:hypothetical protein